MKLKRLLAAFLVVLFTCMTMGSALAVNKTAQKEASTKPKVTISVPSSGIEAGSFGEITVNASVPGFVSINVTDENGIHLITVADNEEIHSKDNDYTITAYSDSGDPLMPGNYKVVATVTSQYGTSSDEVSKALKVVLPAETTLEEFMAEIAANSTNANTGYGNAYGTVGTDAYGNAYGATYGTAGVDAYGNAYGTTAGTYGFGTTGTTDASSYYGTTGTTYGYGTATGTTDAANYGFGTTTGTGTTATYGYDTTGTTGTYGYGTATGTTDTSNYGFGTTTGTGTTATYGYGTATGTTDTSNYGFGTTTGTGTTGTTYGYGTATGTTDTSNYGFGTTTGTGTTGTYGYGTATGTTDTSNYGFGTTGTGTTSTYGYDTTGTTGANYGFGTTTGTTDTANYGFGTTGTTGANYGFGTTGTTDTTGANYGFGTTGTTGANYGFGTTGTTDTGNYGFGTTGTVDTGNYGFGTTAGYGIGVADPYGQGQTTTTTTATNQVTYRTSQGYLSLGEEGYQIGVGVTDVYPQSTINFWNLSSSSPAEQIWQALTSPITVVNVDEKETTGIFDSVKEGRNKLGSVSGLSQGVNVLLSRSDGWSLVEAYRDEDGAFVRGYIRTNRLKVVDVSTTYGIVIDKRTQTLIVYANGIPIGSCLVCTGLPTPDYLNRETPAGEFVTVTRRGTLEYLKKGYSKFAIRINNAINLQEIPTTKKGGSDYSVLESYLGSKQTRGTICIQARASADGGINAEWIWNMTENNRKVKVLIFDDKTRDMIPVGK